MTENNRLKFIRLIFYAVGILFLGYSQTVLAEASKEQKQLFQKAQATFSQAQTLSGEDRKFMMIKAANQFEALVTDDHIENGYLLYNIGNAYYEAGENGKAILYYRRAERLVPGFPDLQANLQTVRQQVKAPEAKKAWWSEIVKSIFFWHYIIDYSTRMVASIVAFVLIWFFLILAIFFRSALIKAGVVSSLVITIAFGSSFLLSAYQLHLVKTGVIVDSQVQVRKGPGVSYESIYEQPLPQGTEFDLLETHGDWWKIRLLNGDEAWVKGSEAEII